MPILAQWRDCRKAGVRQQGYHSVPLPRRTIPYVGGPDDKFIPELVFGQKINKRQRLCASVEYRPDVIDFANYRLNSKAAWESLLDEETHLSMKIGMLDRYDSYADGKEPNDLD